nr:exo-alpha-sialidase [Candidatus Sigynarchaeota archaeon]
MFESKEIFEPFGCAAVEGGKGSNHGSNICEGPSGELIAVWYGGTAEKHEDVQIWMSKKFPGKDWQKPWVCEKEGKTSKIPEEMEEYEGKNASSEGNPVLYFEKEQKRLHLWWITIYGIGSKRGWSTGFIKYKHSDDLGKTWVLRKDNRPRLLHDFWGVMIKNVPIKLSSGDMILPSMAEWTTYSPIYWKCTASEFKKGCLDSQWKKIQTSGTDCFQPTIVELEPGHVLSLMRSTKEGKFSGVMAQMESSDYGETWGMPFANKYGFPNCNANNAMVKLKNGHLVILFNDSPKERNPLTAALSEDGGKTFKYKKNVEHDVKDVGRFHYPCAIQSSDGRIHVTYSNSPHDNIKWASFTEDWIKK